MRLGHIYKITNKIDGKVYIGQTARDIDIRFAEHINAKDSYPLQRAIAKDGWQNFVCEEVESVPLEKLDEREKYWIKFYNSSYNTNQTEELTSCNICGRLRVKENGIVFLSKENACYWFNKVTSWSNSFISKKISECLTSDQDFLSYHFEIVPADEVTSLTAEDYIIDWIKTLNIRYQGKHFHCPQLNLDFCTISEAATYLIDNKLYKGNSQKPLPSLTADIKKVVQEKSDGIESTQGILTFELVPGECESTVADKKVYCQEIDKVFENSTIAAKYFIDNKIWRNIKVKTAAQYISNTADGFSSNYRNYTFKRVD